MKEISFYGLNREVFEELSAELFDILHENMSKIAPTGESYEADKEAWISAVREALKNPERHIIVLENMSEKVGFFMYSVSGDLLKMEEIQFKEKYHSTGAFNELFDFIVKFMPDEIRYVEAFASKKNTKSQGILRHLGLMQVGENQNKNSFRYLGLYSDMKKVIIKS